MIKQFLLPVAIVSLVGLPGYAANEAPQADASKSETISPEQMKLSEEAFKLAGIDKELKQITSKQLKMFYFAKRMSNMAISANETEKKKRNRIAKALNDVFKNDIDLVEEMKPILIKSFAKAYTKKELQEMIDFYKSPTGQKMVVKSPQATDIVYKRTLSEVAPKLDKALRAAIKEEVIDKQPKKPESI